ncbi:MAG: YfiR family protein [Desulfococcaceae bacterium]
MEILTKRIVRIFTVLIGIWIVFIPFKGICSDDDKEYSLKAAFLYNFAKFVQWPDTAFRSPDEPVLLCILGTSFFGNALGTIENREVIPPRRLSVKLCENIGEISGCHMLFISSSESENLSSILSVTQTIPMLTVSDSEGFAQRGVMINLVNIDNKLRFEINTEAVNQMPFRLSSNLLKLAIIVNPASSKE